MLIKEFRRICVKALILASILIGFNSPIYAGIAEYNAAMAAGDYTEAAKQTVDAWKSIDTAKSSSPAVARDFAFINYIVSDYKTAKIFTDELVDKRSDLAKNDDQVLISQVLASLVDFSARNNKRNREALLDALEKRLSDPSVDRVAQIAAQKLLANDWQEKRFANAQNSAAVAIEYYNRLGDSAIVEKYQAEFIAIISEFIRRSETKTFSKIINKDTNSYAKLVQLHNNIFDTGIASNDPELIAKLSPIKWTSNAWALAINTYYQTVLDDNNRSVEPLKRRGQQKFIVAPDAYENDPRPLCEIDPSSMDGRNIEFPSAASFRDMVGSVILKYDVDKDGLIDNASVLAVAPDEMFAQAALEATPKYRLKALPNNSGKECRLEQSNAIFTVNFVIQ